MVCRENAFQDCSGFIMRCLGEKSNVGKRRDLGDLQRNKCGDKGRQLHQSGGVCLLISLSGHVPDQHTLSYLLIKFISNSFLGEGLSKCVCMRVWMPATGVRPQTGEPVCLRGGNKRDLSESQCQP